MINMSQIPADQMIGLFSAEFSEAEPEQVAVGVRLPIMEGQKLPAAPAVVGTRYLITSKGEGATWFGRGSPLHGMLSAFFKKHPSGKCWAVAQTDAGGATAASRAITFTGPATEAGVLSLYINGVLREVSIPDTTIATAIATAVVAAITDDDPVTAAVGGGGSEHIVTFTAKVKGTVGNQITLALNPRGQVGGEQLPAGVGATLAGSYALSSGGVAAVLAAGATNPTAANWVTALGNEPFSLIGLQFDDATAVDALQAELDNRWDALAAKDGVLIVSKADSKADLITYYGLRNDWRMSVGSQPEAAGWLSPEYEATGAYIGIIQRLCVSSGRPVANEQRTPLGIWGAGDNFSDTDRNALAVAGGATYVTENGVAYLEFAGSTRRLTDHGDPEARYQDIQVALSLSWLRQFYKSAVNSAFPRHNLAKDGTAIPGGAEIVTPAGLESWIVSKYASLEGVLVEDVEAFKEALLVEENATNPMRLDAKIEPSFLRRFRVMGMNIALRS